MTRSRPERLRAALLDELLDAAYDAVLARGYDGLRMGDVAARAGVSRQTVYNSFGDKRALAQALVLRETERFLDGIDAALRDNTEPYAAVVAAARFTLQTAADNPLLKEILASARGESLLPLLTTRSEPLLVAARDRLSQHLLERWPDLDRDDVDLVAESAVRLVVSHVVLPLRPIDTVADELGRLTLRALHLTEPERPASPRRRTRPAKEDR